MQVQQADGSYVPVQVVDTTGLNAVVVGALQAGDGVLVPDGSSATPANNARPGGGFPLGGGFGRGG